MNIEKELFKMQDLSYRDFHSRLLPTVDTDKIIGIRVPALRKFAKEIFGTSEAEEFIKTLPHKYYEQNNLHAFLAERYADFERALYETERFLPYIDNWATCDMFLPKVFKKNKDKIINKALMWTDSEHIYTKRYGIGILMKLYLDDSFKIEYMQKVAAVVSDDYYVNMMIAWYFAEALAKRYDDAIYYIENKKLGIWVHNKAIQKAVESRRISEKTKEEIKTLKIKETKI